MNSVSIPIAFFAGLASFFAPCVLPLLPAYIGYVTGLSLGKDDLTTIRKRALITSIFYILGFSLVFVILGSAAAGLGQVFRRYSLLVQIISGLIMIFFGLEFAGIISIPPLSKQNMIKIPTWANKNINLRAFVIGIIFALTWSPCVGAVLGSILALAATSGTLLRGGVLLFFYSVGISIPFLIFSFVLSSLPKYIKVLNNYSVMVTKVAGIVLVLLGALLITDTYKFLNSWILAFFMN